MGSVRSGGVRWTAVVNPAAGRGRTRGLLPRVRAALVERDIPVHESRDIDDARRAARDAFTGGHGVVVCGGDGTVSALAGIAHEVGGALAVVPTGAGNDFARHLGLDHRHPLAAVDVLDTGHLAVVDLGRARAGDGASVVFTTVANAGFDADANRWANGVRWATGTPLYVLAVARTLAVYRPRPARVRVDGYEWSGDAWLVAVGNTRSYAAGMKITPDARLDDGLLDVCILGARSIATFVANFPKVFSGTHTTIDGVTMLRGAIVELDASDPAAELWASGERVGPLPARIEALPGALRVQVPRDSELRRATS
jgi:diacylglycerol kinase (ATP)